MKNNGLIIRSGLCSYKTPTVTVLGCQNEGMLCQSCESNFNRADVGYEDNQMNEI